MEKQDGKFTKEKYAALKTAMKESPFTAAELAEEIVPLLEDCFMGDFKAENGKISFSFPNGQNFTADIKENK